MSAVIRSALIKTRDFGSLVMFSHTLFSLPFAIISIVWAAGGVPGWPTVLWSLIALIAARNGANAFNRLADREFDAANPRTAHRHLSQKQLSVREVWIFVIVNYAVFIAAAGMLNMLCLILSPAAIFLISSYSYTKRFTWLSHLYLGFTIASAPIGAWFAVTGSFAFTPFVLGTIVMLWIGGFDILYGTQDIDFDRKQGLYSIPSTFGLKPALYISRFLHLVMIGLLLFLFVLRDLGAFYLIGIGLAAFLLMLEHGIVKPHNRRLMKIASYNLNQVVSMLILLFTLLDYFL
ncbi:4-hydroxybenzoate octaprenyltransferase [Saccharibacillus qingshengii]|uniref:4-hydroxybenzoate octaprenyltransferase n=1 Tax=Saccharibacillus qingshengii TaxID=1763540 RepID=UPI0015517D28|nr:4-hydroxybenzoate octaprenyltransferase [Saccharibacillus qingshengii]